MKTKPSVFTPLIRFASNHPVQSNGLTYLLTMLSALAAGFPPLFWPCVTAFIILTGVLCRCVLRDIKLCTCVLLVALVTQLPSQAAEPPQVNSAPVIAACVVVLATGAVVVYQITAFCKKRFSAPPEKDTNTSFYATSQGEEYAASSCAHYKGKCPEDGGDDLIASSEPPTPVMVSISGRLVETPSGPKIDAISLKMRPESDLLTREEYAARLATFGLPFNGTCSGCTYYGRNGQPATADQVPIRFAFGSDGTPAVSFETTETTRLVTIERSFDLETWSQIMTTRAPVGKVIMFGDDPDVEHAFYRMTASY